MSVKMNIVVSEGGGKGWNVSEITLPHVIENLKKLRDDVTALGAKIEMTAIVDVHQEVPGRDGEEILQQHVAMLFGVSPEKCARRKNGSFAVKLAW